jgi:hypothetical protein
MFIAKILQKLVPHGLHPKGISSRAILVNILSVYNLGQNSTQNLLFKVVTHEQTKCS